MNAIDKFYFPVNYRAIDSSMTPEKLPMLLSEANEQYIIAFISFSVSMPSFVISYEPKVPIGI